MSVTTLLFHGVDLRDIVIINDISGVYAPMTRRGNHDTIPGRDGQAGAADLPFDAFQFSIPVTVGGDTEADMHAVLANLGVALLGDGTGLGTLTRRLASSGGYAETTAAGACGGLTGITRIDDQTVLCSVLFTNLDGGWQTGAGAWVRP